MIALKEYSASVGAIFDQYGVVKIASAVALVSMALTASTACGGDDAALATDAGSAGDSAVGDGTIVDGASSDGSSDGTSDGATADAGRGPAYDAGTADCPANDGTRRIKLVNNCSDPRWFKLDGRTTPAFARPMTCAWANSTCTDNEGVGQCTAIAKQMSPTVDPGNVYCKAGKCACNPYYELAPGKAVELALPANASFPSGTGWLATGCNTLGAACALGDQAARNSLFEWTYDAPGGSLYYDISAVNAWTTASAVGMKTCGGTKTSDKFHCGGTGCRFDVRTQCPDGTANLAGAPNGCITCPVTTVGGKQVINGSCGPCPNGASANRIPTGTVFNANNVGGTEWTWNGAPDFATTFGADEGVHANRRFTCSGGTCAQGGAPDTCLGGCDFCTATKGVPPDDPQCLKYCCPDITKSYGGPTYRYDSAGCTALGVQRGTDYTATLKSACPYVYTYAYEDHSSTFICETSASLLVQACPDATDFPSSLP